MTTRGIYPFLGHGDLLDPECLHTSISAQGHRVRSRAISLQLSPPIGGDGCENSAAFSVTAGRRRLSRRDWGPTYGPRLSLLSAYQGIPAGLSYWTTMGDIHRPVF